MLSPCARGLTTSPSLVPKHPSLAPNTKAYLGRCHTSGNMKGHVATFSMPTRAWCTGHEGGGDHTSGTGSLPQCSCRETSGPAPPAGEVPGATGRTPSRGGGGTAEGGGPGRHRGGDGDFRARRRRGRNCQPPKAGSSRFTGSHPSQIPAGSGATTLTDRPIATFLLMCLPPVGYDP